MGCVHPVSRRVGKVVANTLTSLQIGLSGMAATRAFAPAQITSKQATARGGGEIEIR